MPVPDVRRHIGLRGRDESKCTLCRHLPPACIYKLSQVEYLPIPHLARSVLLLQACFNCNPYRVSGIGSSQFLEHEHPVHLHRFFAQREFVGDLFGAKSQ